MAAAVGDCLEFPLNDSIVPVPEERERAGNRPADSSEPSKEEHQMIHVEFER